MALIECLQNEDELNEFVALLKRERVRSYLEIGSKFGGSLRRVAENLPDGSRIVAVDLPGGTRMWRHSQPALTKLIMELNDAGMDARVIWGDSGSPNVVDKVRALAPFDAVFIDADHRMPGLARDWENYGPMGRIVAFHDIAWHRAPEWVGVRIDVPKLWDRLKRQYRHQEIVRCPTGKNNGIGVLWRS